MMPSDGWGRRIAEAAATLAELERRDDERGARHGIRRKKMSTPEEAQRARLKKKSGAPIYTRVEIDRRLGELIDFGWRGDVGDSQDEAGEASHG